jgi:hypothetical protein
LVAAAGGPKGSPPLVGADVLAALGPRGILRHRSLRGRQNDVGRADPATGAARRYRADPGVERLGIALSRMEMTPERASRTFEKE